VLILLLIMSDIAFIVVHIAYMFDLVHHQYFSLESDRGYGEIFQYLKFFWIICLLSIFLTKVKASVILSWIFIFAYMLIDDSLSIHERVGSSFVELLNLRPALQLRAQDYGELLVSMTAGIFLFGFLFVTHKKSSSDLKDVSRRLLFLAAGIIFFGVAVDMIHSMLPLGKEIFGLIEDAGEMIFASLSLGYCVSIILDRNFKAVPKSLSDTSMPKYERRCIHRRATD